MACRQKGRTACFRSSYLCDGHSTVLQHGAMLKFGVQEGGKRDSPSALGDNDKAARRAPVKSKKGQRQNEEET